jgi:hypothetical protein
MLRLAAVVSIVSLAPIAAASVADLEKSIATLKNQWSDLTRPSGVIGYEATVSVRELAHAGTATDSAGKVIGSEFQRLSGQRLKEGRAQIWLRGDDFLVVHDLVDVASPTWLKRDGKIYELRAIREGKVVWPAEGVSDFSALSFDRTRLQFPLFVPSMAFARYFELPYPSAFSELMPVEKVEHRVVHVSSDSIQAEALVSGKVNNRPFTLVVRTEYKPGVAGIQWLPTRIEVLGRYVPSKKTSEIEVPSELIECQWESVHIRGRDVAMPISVQITHLNLKRPDSTEIIAVKQRSWTIDPRSFTSDEPQVAPELAERFRLPEEGAVVRPPTAPPEPAPRNWWFMAFVGFSAAIVVLWILRKKLTMN